MLHRLLNQKRLSVAALVTAAMVVTLSVPMLVQAVGVAKPKTPPIP